MSAFLRKLLILFLVVISTFFLFSLLPADPALSILGVNANQDAVIALRNKLGLDKSVIERAIQYFSGLLRGDFGISYVTMRPVSDDLWSAFFRSISYAGIALIIATLYSFSTAMLSLIYSDLIIQIVRIPHRIILSAPSVIISLFSGLIIYKFNLFYFANSFELKQYMMAGIALSINPACILAEVLIKEVSAVRNMQFTWARRSIGFGNSAINWMIIRNSLVGWFSQIANTAAALFSGSVVIEYIFSLPGLGRLIHQSIMRSDYPMLQGVVLVTSSSFLLLSICTDSIHQKLFKKTDE